MVDTPHRQADLSSAAVPGTSFLSPRRRVAVGLVPVLLFGAGAVTVGLLRTSTPPNRASSVVKAIHTAPAMSVSRTKQVDHGAMAAAKSTSVATPTVVTTAHPAAPTNKAVAAAIPAPPVAVPSVASLVARVEAAGVEPGANWSWSMGNTATMCGPISGVGTGCTWGTAGVEQTVFTGVPTLALVAHELANAETQSDATPSLLSEVAAAEAGTAWSPTDAVASCLVAHFMGFQDLAAGTWQCPAALATVVAENT